MLREYDEVLKCINLLEQDPSNFDGSRRRMKMAADIFAIKGRFCSLLASVNESRLIRSSVFKT